MKTSNSAWPVIGCIVSAIVLIISFIASISCGVLYEQWDTAAVCMGVAVAASVVFLICEPRMR